LRGWFGAPRKVRGKVINHLVNHLATR
jgi:hypothetical protein